MKIIFTFLLTAVFSMVAMGQNIPNYSHLYDFNKIYKGKEVFRSISPERPTPHFFLKNIRHQYGLKSSNSEKQELDSIIYEYWDENAEQLVIEWKDEFSYNEDAKLAIEYSSYWDDSNEQWMISSKVEYTYDNNWNIIGLLTKIWIDSTNQWVNRRKQENHYDSNGNRTKYINSTWDTDLNQWVVTQKYENTYDTNGNITENNSYEWDPFSSSGYSYNTKYTYDNDGYILHKITYYKGEPDGPWTPSSKIVYTLDSIQNIIQSITYGYEGGQFAKNQIKVEYNYDSYGNEVYHIKYSWNDSTWEESQKAEYNYESNGNLKYYAIYDWIDNTWKGWDKEESIYDNIGNITQYNDYEWIDSTCQWVIDWKYELSYDITFSFEDLVVPYYYNGVVPYIHNPTSMLIGYTSYWEKDNSDQWIPDERATYYYSVQNNSGIANNNELNVLVYPNPTTDYIVIEMENWLETAFFELFDIRGCRVASSEFYANMPLYVGNLNSGIYFFKLTRNGEKLFGKIIIYK